MLLLLCFPFPTAAPAAVDQAPAPKQLERYAGEGQIGTEPPFPVHLEIRRTEPVEGVISSPGAAFKLVNGRGSDVVTGAITGDGGNGSITLRFAVGKVDGTFELEGQWGTLRADATTLDAAAFFKGPDQKLDLTTAEWRQDLDRLVEILTIHHGFPFHRTSKEAFGHEVKRIHAAIPQLQGHQVALEFVKLGALIGDGHTWSAYPAGRPRFNLELYWFEDGIRVVGAEQDQAELLGARLLAIEDVPVAEAQRRLRVFAAQGETEWGYRSVAPYLIGSADMLDTVDIGSEPSRRFTFYMMNGEERQVALTASVTRPARIILGGGPPLWERGTEPFRLERLADGTVYVNWRSYENLAQHTGRLLTELDRNRPRRLVIDLRDNGGGDYNHGRQFVGQLASREWLNRPDVLFVLTGRQTFSAAMTNAVDFKRMTRATLIGEPPGAAPNNWQEVRRFNLPNSGLAVGVSTKYYEFLPGESAVRPDLHIPPVPSDWGAPHDSAVRYVLGLPCAS